MTEFALLIAVTLLLLFALLWSEIRKHTLSHISCESLITRLGPVQIDGIILAAHEDFDAFHGAGDVEEKLLWHMIGGWHGLKQMHDNSGLLIALATHAQRWDLHGSFDAAESMYKDALIVRRAAMRFVLGRLFRYRKSSCIGHLKEAAAAYYAMTERLLGLYETSPSRLYTRLSAAVWPSLAMSSRSLQA